MIVRVLPWTIMTLALGLITPRAHAYSDPSGFASQPLDDGGGGGRWFTGSPADGYTCGVCHSGGVAPALTVRGLPIDGYIPGASYEIVIDWPDALAHLGISVEITDELGGGAGTISLPQAGAVDALEECASTFGTGILATSMNEVAPKDPTLAARRVMNVADCGARRLRFLWTAPPQATTQLWLSGAIVAADGMGDVHGDGVTDIARPITARGGEPVASTVGGCAVGRAPSSLVGWWMVVWIVLWSARRRSVAAATTAAGTEPPT